MSNGNNTDDVDITCFTQTYKGPLMIERMYYVFKNTSSSTLAEQAAIIALEQMERYESLSPFYKELTERVSNSTSLSESEKVYGSKGWSTALMAKSKSSLASLYSSLDAPKMSLSDEDIFEQARTLSIMYSIQHEHQLAIDSLSYATGNKNTHYCTYLYVDCQNDIFKQRFTQVLHNSKRVDTYLSQINSNESLKVHFTEGEAVVAWKIKWLGVLAKFSMGLYFEAIGIFFNLIHAGPILNVFAIDVLNSPSFNEVINKEDIVLMVCLSIILTRPSRTLIDFLSDEKFGEIVSANSDIIELFDALRFANYGKIEKVLNDMDPYLRLDLFIGPNWQHFRLITRQKTYLSYLSVVKFVSADHMATKLGLPADVIIKEVNELVVLLNLDIRYDAVTKYFEYSASDERVGLLESVNNLSEEFAVSSRAFSVYSLVTKSLISENR